jgi:hypothetical protein
LVALGLAVWAFGLGLRRFKRIDDIMVQLLVAGTVIIIAAYVFGPQATSVGTSPGSSTSSNAPPFGPMRQYGIYLCRA